MDTDDTFASIFAQAFGRPLPGGTGKPASNPLPAIRGREEDGVLYVRAEDVADALEQLGPAVNAPLIAKLRHGLRRTR